MKSSFNRHSNFDRNFNRMNKLFWVMFSVAAVLIVVVWIAVFAGIYTVVSNPEAVGTIAADVIRPVAEAVRGE